MKGFPIRRSASLLAVLFLGMTGTSQAQLGLTESPLTGNPVDLQLSYYSGEVSGITLVIHPNPGQVQGSCYIYFQNTGYYGGFPVTVYETVSGSLDNPVAGNVGWQQTLTSGECAVDLGASSVNGYGASLRVLMSQQRLANSQVVASYTYRTCDEYCSYDTVTATIGSWNSAPDAGGVLYSPSPGSMVPCGIGSACTFTWAPGVNATQYCLQVGSTVGGSDVFAPPCTSATSSTAPTLPHDGRGLYVTLTTLFSAAASVVHQYALIARDDSVPVDLTQPVPTHFSSPTTLSWTLGQNVSAFEITVVTDGGATVYHLPRTTVGPASPRQATFSVPAGLAYITVKIQSWLPNGIAARTYFLTPATAPVLPTPTFQPPVFSSATKSVTVSWTSGPATAQYYLTAGRSSGSVQIYPGVPTSQAAAYFTSTSKTFSLQGYQDGGTVYVNLFWRANDTSEWNVTSTRFSAPASGDIPPPPSPSPATLRLDGVVARQGASVQWDAGSNTDGVYWLNAGTAPGASDLYNTYNNGVPGILQKTSADLTPIPNNVATVYFTLSTRIGGVWYSNSYSAPAATPTASSLSSVCMETASGGCVQMDVQACVDIPGATCRIGPGVFGIDARAAETTPVQPYHRRIIITKSGVTLKGDSITTNSNGQSYPVSTTTTLVRMNAAWPDGCAPLIQVGPGTGPEQENRVTGVTVMNLGLDGNNRSFTDACTNPAQQPNVNDVIVASYTSGINLSGIAFLNSAGRSLSISGSYIQTVNVGNSAFRNASLTGLLVFSDGEPVDGMMSPATGLKVAAWTVCDPMTDYPAAVQNVVVSQSLFDGSWTGATAFNHGKDLVITSSVFSNNYWNPYDKAGGTSFVEQCVKGAKFQGSIFLGQGLTSNTTAIEIHAAGVEIDTNFIAGYPFDAIGLNSAAKTVIKNNVIQNNNQQTYYRQGAVVIFNRATGVEEIANHAPTPYQRRLTGDTTFENNAIGNGPLGDPYGNRSQPYAIEIRPCPDPQFGCSDVIPGTLLFVGGIKDVGSATSGNDLSNNVYQMASKLLQTDIFAEVVPSNNSNNAAVKAVVNQPCGTQ